MTAGFETHREYHHIKFFAVPFALIVGIVNHEFVAARIHRMDATANEANILFNGIVQIVFEPFAVGSHIHIKNGRFNVFVKFFGIDRFLKSIHAADAGAIGCIAMVDVP